MPLIYGLKFNPKGIFSKNVDKVANIVNRVDNLVSKVGDIVNKVANSANKVANSANKVGDFACKTGDFAHKTGGFVNKAGNYTLFVRPYATLVLPDAGIYSLTFLKPNHFMATTTKGRIVKPKNPSEGLALAAKVFQKHKSDGSTSELKNLDGYNWDTVGPTIIQAQDYHKAAEDFKGKMEEQYRLRDAAYKPIQEITDASSTYLKGKYAKNPKKLADWGYAIDDTPQKRKPKKSA